jgi:monoamine oxidase
MYDYVIVGGGISGLYSCYTLLKNNPKLKILIIEQSGRWGGRIYTKKRDGVTFESGAGRFHSSHINLMKLLKECNLYEKCYELSKDVSYFLKNQWIYNDDHLMKLYNSSFKSLYDMWKFILKNPPKDYSMTLYEYCKSIGFSTSEANCLKDTFGYYTELHQLNAKNSFDIIKEDFTNGQYYILSGGLQQLIDSLVSKCSSMGAKMLLQSTCISIDTLTNTIEHIHNNKKHTVNSNKIIIAIPITNLNNIDINPKLEWPIREQPKPFQLCRIYAKYSDVWFKNMPKMITDKKISMIIPVDYEKGLIMISYSDNKNAEFWNSFDSHDQIKKELLNELNIMFPNLNISNPDWLSIEYWNEGCHYWGKNKDDSEIMNNIQDTKMDYHI